MKSPRDRRRSVVVHGHFYQPPRENPWTGEVPVEASAAPFHDWNQRVYDECYRAVVAARVLDGQGRIADVVNTLEWISWDAGPTLVSWLARSHPETYRALLEADARSVARLGHGNALAAPYHHTILPLASLRDKVTEVRWGMADFRRRFGREPEGMWLPETAVDTETLEVLAQEGILFTVLAPTQVDVVPERGMPGLVRLPSGASMAVFVYDGSLSHDVAFGELLGDAHAWATRMAEGGGKDRALMALATDGETFGHHHRWGDLALAAAVQAIHRRDDVRLDNLGAFLESNPPTEEVKLVEPSAWSCAHGVDRWRADCGCKLDPSKPTQQAWRTVLRDSLNDLATHLHDVFEQEGGAIFADPWRARDGYGEVFDQGEAARVRFAADQAARTLNDPEVQRALELLEMERDALRMFTSCGWFFDDMSGLEPLQVLRYAAHALDLAGPAAAGWEDTLRTRLREARSNDPEAGTGADLWDREVRETAVSAEPMAGRGTPEAPTAGRRDDAVPHAGTAPLEAIASLNDAVGRFIRAPEQATARDVQVHAGLLEAEGIPIPFEAQTQLGRALPRLLATAPAHTRAVARVLGFGESAGHAPTLRANGPVGFVFGLHVHQPVGNFDEVFRSHAHEVYLPFLRRLAERGALPVALHVSGPLLEWMAKDGHEYLDLVGRLVADGSVELLLSGFYEPVLPALTRMDRVEQIGWMRDWLAGRFGVTATGLWLTERVWEPDLAEDLADAGVEYALVDDRHFLATGFEQRQLHQPWRTASGGKSLSLLPIDERLRYLIPFRPPEEFADYMRALQAQGQPLAVLADDGEKFGGWPGTADWVWRDGWLDRYLDTLDALVDLDVVRLTTPSQALARVPTGGLAYLPSASYREMEGWSLPPAAARRLEVLEDRTSGPDNDPAARPLLRGGHWRNFLARYTESNRMHKKAEALSELCRERGDPPGARRAVGRAQCNDSYWHGVFGGLYLRHLRGSVWANLAEAEGILRAGEELAWDTIDLDGDGHQEIWLHSHAFSALVTPARGGAVEEWTLFEKRINLADTLTRRREAYHRDQAAMPGHAAGDEAGMPSIHALEEGLRFDTLPPADREERGIGVVRVLDADLDADTYEGADYDAIRSWAGEAMEVQVAHEAGRITLLLESGGPGALRTEIAVDTGGTLSIHYRWDPSAFPPHARFAPEFSMNEEATMALDPTPEAVWRYDIRTVSKSEKGADTSVQGVSVTPLWPAQLGEARVALRP
ncbi:MAG TPA: alpha-amylase/4-alpha-glucanotransferase domain-containing protein [Longimicrobiales bacterium]|nr:alpha-amylase/4-alpha-glucanotransferase domain-containing protein [Longimicrobiales bacterium]